MRISYIMPLFALNFTILICLSHGLCIFFLSILKFAFICILLQQGRTIIPFMQNISTSKRSKIQNNWMQEITEASMVTTFFVKSFLLQQKSICCLGKGLFGAQMYVVLVSNDDPQNLLVNYSFFFHAVASIILDSSFNRFMDF